MATPPGFYAYDQKALREGATTPVDGRLQAEIPVAITDNLGGAESPSANYELFGPGDVQRLAAGAITRRYPPPNVSDAEKNKMPLVEFSKIDLPWRYTPQVASGAVLRPWLVLVVAKPGADGIIRRPDGRVTIGVAAQLEHLLSLDRPKALHLPVGTEWSGLWAHVHQVADHDPIARIVSPVRLDDTTGYIAAVVPAFTADGGDSWDGSAPVTLDCYDAWTFRTGPAGDFESLAKALHAVDPTTIVSPAGKPFGQADVTYTSRDAAHTPTVLATAGALRLPDSGPANPVDEAPPTAVATETSLLTKRLTTPDGRAVITAPRYEAPFGDATSDAPPPAGGWIDQLRSDARLRGAASLGVANAIAWQDRIADAASARAGDLAIAHDRIRHVALGVEVSRSLWNRRLPAMPDDPGADPEATARAAASRLAVLSPMLGRLPTTTDESALDVLTERTPDLTVALLSSAGRRALRPGPARTALGATPRAHVGAAIITANACVPAPSDPGQWQPPRRGNPGDTVGHPVNPLAGVKDAIFAAAHGNDALAGQIVDHLDRVLNSPPPGVPTGQFPGAVLAAFALLASSPKGDPDPASTKEFLGRWTYPQPDESLVPDDSWVGDTQRPERCDPVDIVAFATAVASAVDPTGPRPPVLRRVLATLPGITSMQPVEVEPEIDLPLWSWLRDNQPDWMLPGAADLEEGDVVALATNPDFVEALLTGANYQTTGELRWRNIPLTTRFSPLRRFWQRADGTLDISPIKSWAPAQALGSPSLSAGPGAEAVVAFRTQLFRRYPTTLVYLYPHTSGLFTTPGGVTTDAWSPNVTITVADRVEFTFRGNIGADVTFFGFPIAPDDLADYWVVLEEPPLGYRFNRDRDVVSPVLGFPKRPDPAADADSAKAAYRHFALPIRVLIGPLPIKEVTP